MARLLLAQPTSDNAPAGSLFSLWFLLSLFAVVAAILWVLYSRPHRRVPPRRAAPAPAAGQARGATAAGTPPSRRSGEEPGPPGQGGEIGPHGHNAPPGGEDPRAGR
jgi:hypothetical protein